MGNEKEPIRTREVKIYSTNKLFLLKLKDDNPNLDYTMLMSIAAKLTAATYSNY
jgi:hypothetical protein